MTSLSFACFTPSLMPENLLERTFVAREPILKTIMKRVEKLGKTPSPNHTLFVGSYGVGKTHLISLAYHRSVKLADGQRNTSLRIARLPETPWRITSYARLLAAILNQFSPTEMKSADEISIEAQLRGSIRVDGPIVVFMENVSQIFEALGQDGQQKLRSLLQTETGILIIGSTTRLDRSLSDHASPFFGFFDTIRLEPFTPEEAREMLSTLAHEADNAELAEYASGPDVMVQIRTITHLTGGVPRVWAMLGSALDAADFEGLSTLLLARIDAFTPYYQEQLAQLSPLQRLVMAELVAANRPLPVKDLAERVGSEQRTVAKAISDLSERAWIKPVSTLFTDLLDQRRSYYDLVDPLARLVLQLKDSDTLLLPSIVHFLETWFGTEGLTASSSFELLGEVEDALASAAQGDAEPMMALPSTAREAIEIKVCDVEGISSARLNLLAKAAKGADLLPSKDIIEWLARAERLDHELQSTQSRLTLVRWLAASHRFEEAEAALGTITSAQEAQEGARALSDAHQARN